MPARAERIDGTMEKQNKITETQRKFIDKFESNTGAKGVFDGNIFCKSFCKLEEMSAWEFGNILMMFSHNAAVQVLENVECLFAVNYEDDKFSKNDIAKIIKLVAEELKGKANEIYKEI